MFCAKNGARPTWHLSASESANRRERVHAIAADNIAPHKPVARTSAASAAGCAGVVSFEGELGFGAAPAGLVGLCRDSLDVHRDWYCECGFDQLWRTRGLAEAQ